MNQLKEMVNIWKMRQTDLNNIAQLFISTIEQNKKKKGITELNALLARLNAKVCTGNLFIQIEIMRANYLIIILSHFYLISILNLTTFSSNT